MPRLHTESVNVRIYDEGPSIFGALDAVRDEIIRLQNNGYEVHQVHIDEMRAPLGHHSDGADTTYPISIIASRSVEGDNAEEV